MRHARLPGDDMCSVTPMHQVGRRSLLVRRANICRLLTLVEYCGDVVGRRSAHIVIDVAGARFVIHRPQHVLHFV